MEGPDFLSKPNEAWPKRPEELTATVPDDDPEVKKSSLVYATNVSISSNNQFMERFIERFSSWSRLKRVLTWILCYKRNRAIAKARAVRISPINRNPTN
jgi:hypothetical protein